MALDQVLSNMSSTKSNNGASLGRAGSALNLHQFHDEKTLTQYCTVH
jgi:hypothetical protein